MNINLGAHFLFLLFLCCIKIERLLFLKFLKILAFFDSYFWPFDKAEEKSKVIFVISAIILSIWNVFIKFHWHDEKLTRSITSWKTIFLLLYFTFAFLCIGKCQAVIFWSLENKLEIRSFKPVLLGGKSDNGLILKWTGFCKLVKEKKTF